jgi:hypothetical protein
MNKRVNLDKLEAELEKWRGECCLPCEVVAALIAELRQLRDAAPCKQAPCSCPCGLPGGSHARGCQAL